MAVELARTSLLDLSGAHDARNKASAWPPRRVLSTPMQPAASPREDEQRATPFHVHLAIVLFYLGCAIAVGMAPLALGSDVLSMAAP